ncbi:helix-turn-helix transcriptional regulator [Paenibacillus mesophilus]|uniref:helix-turn-helix domain-containing protein n=1 Tax=Paenibacillus mesophilus TaxID=2582849 RepID=UPI00110ECB9E|nr:helix-turn-helix transcriptional regulator [Paenibacillus mesophilus]
MKRLRELRTCRQWSQMELARKSGVSQSFINYLEAGTKQPTLTTLNKLALAFGVPVSELLDSSEQTA